MWQHGRQSEMVARSPASECSVSSGKGGGYEISRGLQQAAPTMKWNVAGN
eukprot:CAMPEP_0174331644 /NCGR_PEP_ID=MMETSP0810-20121108/17654_1 /TAXON_ID=73025 ORGANISM="Eutreptiella gymnastica-like, Strain CCMP1594" /NCGR_SAMPLE_ID=MMETSP0810 /ASSEMBLY_ACC=CAM_ASM_000659 /LENGTH=49 /DNA_ID= /DNA_START= /DNA_END= /DNA_ORIENTATION=